MLIDLGNFIVEIWIFLGLLCLIVELFKLPGLGFLFIGLGSLTTGAVLYYDLSFYKHQIIILLISCFVWFLLLYYPLKLLNRNDKESSVLQRDIVGQEVVVVGLEESVNDVMQVKWSGVIMQAKFVEDGAGGDHKVKLGDKLIINRIEGNRLICSKNSQF